MSGWSTWASYAYGPVVALLGLAALVLVLRWAFGGTGSSLVERRSRRAAPDDYGMLRPLSAPATYVEGEVQRRRLEGQGVRATLAMTDDGPRVLVWPEDEARARELLDGR